MDSYAERCPDAVIDAQPTEQGQFLARTYGHLVGAVGAFVLLEFLFFAIGFQEIMLKVVVSSRWSWLLILGAFMVVSWLASRAAHTAISKPVQYGALGLFVLAEGIIFLPLLAIAERFFPGTITNAAILTFLLFGALTAVVFYTRKDFSFLRGILIFGGIAALIAIVGAVIFGFTLGWWFSVLMIGFACCAILYDTSKIMREYPTDRYVGASLELFASLALLFWYVLQLLMQLRSDD